MEGTLFLFNDTWFVQYCTEERSGYNPSCQRIETLKHYVLIDKEIAELYKHTFISGDSINFDIEMTDEKFDYLLFGLMQDYKAIPSLTNHKPNFNPYLPIEKTKEKDWKEIFSEYDKTNLEAFQNWLSQNFIAPTKKTNL